MSKRVLVIDDDPAVRDAYVLALEDEDLALELAEDGERGLAAARRLRPDLVFLDLKMPGMDGVEVLRHLNSEYADLCVYIVTAFANEYVEELRRARNDGLKFQVAAKPLSHDQIHSITKLNLEQPDGSGEGAS